MLNPTESVGGVIAGGFDSFTTGGKSGLRRAGWSITSTGREVRESAAENRPPNGSCGSPHGTTIPNAW